MDGEHGFTLVEMLLVATMIGIVAAIAVPSVSRARGIAIETSTIGSLRALNSAQTSFATSCGGGYYAPSVTWLTRPPDRGRASFIGPEFSRDTVDRLGYRIRFTAGTRAVRAPRSCNGLAAGRAVESYFIGADPLQAGPAMGTRHFGTTASSTIYQSPNRLRVFYSGTPPPPAKPIQ